MNSPSRREFLRRAGQLAMAGAGPASMLRADSQILRIVAVGDCLITRRLSTIRDARFKPLVEIIRGSDAAFGNFEMTLAPNDAAPGLTGACGDLDLKGDPFLAEEMGWAGFRLLGLANNHAYDYGPEGMLATSQRLDAAGVAHAGTGRNLAEARSPAYYDSPNGRVALIACASTFRAWSMASDANPEIPGRPGLNAVRVRNTYHVRPDEIESLKKIAAEVGSRGGGLIPQTDGQAFNFLGARFTAESPPGLWTEADPRDVRDITAQVRRASRNADLVLLGIHAHEGQRSRDVPAGFLQPLARACVDAGADAFIGHGPHVLRGIEIYKNRPIFYSLGNFIFQAESMKQIPREIYETCGITGSDPSDFFDRAMKSFSDDAYWEAVVPLTTFEDRKLTDLKLYPITLGSELSRSLRGSPVLAEPHKAQLIIERLAKLSEPYGTRIRYKDGIGVVLL